MRGGNPLLLCDVCAILRYMSMLDWSLCGIMDLTNLAYGSV